jgi:hypothetical protein
MSTNVFEWDTSGEMDLGSMGVWGLGLLKEVSGKPNFVFFCWE